jgi:hypothetical protein
LFIALPVAVLAVAGQGALPGRVDSVDLVRLRAYGTGRIEAGGPGLEAATGWQLAFGFGAPGCDGGRRVREIIHPYAALDLEVPAGTQRVDIVLRAVAAHRSLRVFLEEAELGGAAVGPSWHRLSIPLTETHRGRHRLKLQLSPLGTPAAPEPGTWSEGTLGLLEAVVFGVSAATPQLDPGPVADPRVFWLEAGEEACLPVRLETGQALETSGTVRRGAGADELEVVVELVTAYGVRRTLASLPATLDIPWNLHLAESYHVEPVRLCLTARGERGAVGLEAPRLTLPGTPPPASQPIGDRDVVLVAIRGLGWAETQATRPRLTGQEPIGEVWTTATTPRHAIASLLTGRYPASLGLRGLAVALPPGTATLAERATRAGRRTLMRAGWVPLAADSPVFAGMADAQIAAPPGFLPHTAEVLDALLGALSRARGPALAVGLLGDPGAPYSPRAEHWKHHNPPAGKPPWEPLGTPEIMRLLADGKKQLSGRERQYLEALRRGKLEETLEAVERFVVSLAGLKRPAPPLVLVVGLGGEAPWPDADALSPDEARVPLWWLDAATQGGAAFALGDLTDVAATVAALVGAEAQDLDGTDLRLGVPKGFSPAVFVTDAGLRDLVVSDRMKLVLARQPAAIAPRGSLPPSPLTRWSSLGWRPEPYPEVAELLGVPLERRMAALTGAGPRWTARSFDPPALTGLPPGSWDVCGR